MKGTKIRRAVTRYFVLLIGLVTCASICAQSTPNQQCSLAVVSRLVGSGAAVCDGAVVQRMAAEGQALADTIDHASQPGLVTHLHMSTDHAFSDHRIALQAALVSWLQERFPLEP